ncbi:MAG: hypothetical protein ABR604_09200 [Jatrophihabitantaceae bacterium]
MRSGWIGAGCAAVLAADVPVADVAAALDGADVLPESEPPVTADLDGLLAAPGVDRRDPDPLCVDEQAASAASSTVPAMSR